jgi:hypothetical protein
MELLKFSLLFPHNDLLESPVGLVSCRQSRRPCSIKSLFCEPNGSHRRRNSLEQSRFSNSQCEEVVHRVFVLGPCFKSSESNKEVRPGSIEAFCYASLVDIPNAKRGTLIFSHHADSLDRWAPSSSVSRPYNAMTLLYHRFPQPYSRRRSLMGWPLSSSVLPTPDTDWVNWPLQPRIGYKMGPFNQNRRYGSSSSIQARKYHCSCSSSTYFNSLEQAVLPCSFPMLSRSSEKTESRNQSKLPPMPPSSEELESFRWTLLGMYLCIVGGLCLY